MWIPHHIIVSDNMKAHGTVPWWQNTHTHQVLVRKSYGDKAKRAKQRNWQLQMMDREMDVTMATANQEGAEQDYQEEDMGYRKNVNIYFSEWNPAIIDPSLL